MAEDKFTIAVAARARRGGNVSFGRDIGGETLVVAHVACCALYRNLSALTPAVLASLEEKLGIDGNMSMSS